MKKVLTVLLAAVMSVSLFAGCSNSGEGGQGSASTPGSDSPVANQEQGKQLKIGIVQYMDHPSLNTIRESLVAELATLGYKDKENVAIDYKNSQGDQVNLNSICQKFVSDKKDLIIAIATPAAQTAASATSDIPVLFSAVTDPVAAKLVADLNKPGRNVSGTSDAIPVDKIFDLALKLTPNVKKIGLLYSTSEANSLSVISDAKKVAKEKNLEVVETGITNVGELQQAAQSLISKTDAIFTPIDNQVASAMSTLSKVGIDAKKPVYVGADSMVSDGGFATVGINYTELGKKTAEMAKEIFEGKTVADMPVQTLSDFGTVINETTASKIGVTVPEDILSGAQIVK